MIRVWDLNISVFWTIASAVMVLILSAAPVLAQDFQNISHDHMNHRAMVVERTHPDYQPHGIHQGSFVLYPAIDVSTVYNDNIFATDNNTKGDFITQIAPSLRLQNLPSTRHNLVADLSLKQGLYTSNSDENYTDYNAHLASRIYAHDALWFDGDLTFEHIHEDRTSPNVLQTIAEPLQYNRAHAGASATYKPGLMRVTLGGEWDNYQFDNTAQIGGGQVIQNDRDRDEYRAKVELAYEFKPRYEAFLNAGVNTIRYDRNDFVVGPNTYTGSNRDSKGFDILGGVRFDLTSLIRADLGVGYLAQRYDQTGLSDISGVNIHGDIAWNATPLTTLNLNINRAVQETISAGSSGYLETSAHIGVDHELKRNIILSIGGQFAVQDYEGTNQKDDVLRFNTGATYNMNRNVSWMLEYLYDQRRSNQANLDFKRNIIMLRAKFKL